MKKSFFPLLICGLIIACAPDNTAKKTNDPIENLIAYLDEREDQYARRTIEYEGGRYLKTTVSYFLVANAPATVAVSRSGLREAEKTFRAREEVIDSCFRAFRWGCSSARQCYHKENHVLDKDTVLYALGLDVLDGEKMELEGVGVNEYYMAQYKAARAATMKYRADKETTSATIDYITREETGKEEEPFDMTPVLDYIKKAVAATDSVQVYETSYECSAEDWDTANALWLITGKDRSRDGITKGHLYVFPKAESQHIQYELTAYVKDNYLNKHTRCNQKFCLRMYHVFTGDMLVLLPYPLMMGEIKSNLLYSGMSQDGKFHILVIDEVNGAFLLPSGWKHIIRFQDHKPEYIPGTENREYWD
ncbi:MAG: hypothetical protein J6W60_12795 [Treponema sp.]|nr:hypothetical protein [Treponema sp.]